MKTIEFLMVSTREKVALLYHYHMGMLRRRGRGFALSSFLKSLDKSSMW